MWAWAAALNLIGAQHEVVDFIFIEKKLERRDYLRNFHERNAAISVATFSIINAGSGRKKQWNL